MLNPISSTPRPLPVRATEAPAAASSAPEAQAPAETVSGTIKIRKHFFSWLRPTYDVVLDGKKIGTLQRKFFSFKRGWKLKDAKGHSLGEVSPKMSTLGFVSTIRDEHGDRVGQIKQDIVRSAFNPTAALRLLDSKGKVVAKTDPVWLTFTGRINLKDADGDVIGSFRNKLLSLTESNQLTLDKPLDKRLVMGFIASQLEVKHREEAERKQEEEDEKQREKDEAKASD